MMSHAGRFSTVGWTTAQPCPPSGGAFRQGGHSLGEMSSLRSQELC